MDSTPREGDLQVRNSCRQSEFALAGTAPAIVKRLNDDGISARLD
jgi:hypothetical protein